MGIRRDLVLGDIAEIKVVNLLNHVGLSAEKNSDKTTRKFYDIIVKTKTVEFTVEVKNDIYAVRSGNIAIELFNPKSGKPSGLGVTTSMVWVVMIGEELWLANTERLKKYVNNTKPKRIIDSAGDGNALIYLYDRDIILPTNFTRVDNISNKQTLKRTIVNELD